MGFLNSGYTILRGLWDTFNKGLSGYVLFNSGYTIPGSYDPFSKSLSGYVPGILRRRRRVGAVQSVFAARRNPGERRF